MSKITKISSASAAPAASPSRPVPLGHVPGADGPSAATAFEQTLGVQRNAAVRAHEASAQAAAVAVVAQMLAAK
jgi:hypothetical protein